MGLKMLRPKGLGVSRWPFFLLKLPFGGKGWGNQIKKNISKKKDDEVHVRPDVAVKHDGLENLRDLRDFISFLLFWMSCFLQLFKYISQGLEGSSPPRPS